MTGNQNQKKRPPLKILLLILLISVLVLAALPAGETVIARLKVSRLETAQVPDWVDVQLIDIDGTSRRGELLEDINDIVIHYVGNPGTTAKQNRSWYTSPASEVSSHFLVGLEGEIIQCIPLCEKSSASNHRNRDTISIEVCHPGENGKFNDETYAALVELTAWLLETCGLDVDNIIRHYDITGKQCPKYYVINEESWNAFKADVSHAVK